MRLRPISFLTQKNCGVQWLINFRKFLLSDVPTYGKPHLNLSFRNIFLLIYNKHLGCAVRHHIENNGETESLNQFLLDSRKKTLVLIGIITPNIFPLQNHPKAYPTDIYRWASILSQCVFYPSGAYLTQILQTKLTHQLSHLHSNLISASPYRMVVFLQNHIACLLCPSQLGYNLW